MARLVGAADPGPGGFTFCSPRSGGLCFESVIALICLVKRGNAESYPPVANIDASGRGVSLATLPPIPPSPAVRRPSRPRGLGDADLTGVMVLAGLDAARAGAAPGWCYRGKCRAAIGPRHALL